MKCQYCVVFLPVFISVLCSIHVKRLNHPACLHYLSSYIRVLSPNISMGWEWGIILSKVSKVEAKVFIYRVSQEECARLQESVPYVKLYRYNPKHLYPKFNGYGDNGQRSLKIWQLLLTYWLPNTHWNWQEYVVSVMLIAVCNIKVTRDIKPLNWTTKTLTLVS